MYLHSGVFTLNLEDNDNVHVFGDSRMFMKVMTMTRGKLMADEF